MHVRFSRRLAGAVAVVTAAVLLVPSPSLAETLENETVTVPSPAAPLTVPDPVDLVTDAPDADLAVPSDDPTAGSADDSTVIDAPVPTVATLDPYRSLAFAMTSFYAQRAGESMTSFVARNAPTLAAFGAIDELAVEEPEALLAQLASVDLFASLGDPSAPALGAGGLSLDDAVVVNGADWAARLADLRLPGSLSAPRPQVSSPEALATGVVLNRSLINFVNGSPDLFAQVTSSGVGSPKAQAAWRQSMSQAISSANGSITGMFPSPCSAAMLAAMGTGSAKDASKLAGKGCTPCLTAGLYMNSQMGGLFGPGPVSALPQGTAGLIPPGEWNQLPQWQQNLLSESAPSLSSGLNSTMASSGSCQTASAATSSALSSALPGIFSNLSSGGSLPGPFANLRP